MRTKLMYLLSSSSISSLDEGLSLSEYSSRNSNMAIAICFSVSCSFWIAFSKKDPIAEKLSNVPPKMTIQAVMIGKSIF